MNIKLLKTVIKVAFKKLKAKKFIYSNVLEENIFITRDLWEHLLFKKRRNEKEVIERLLTVLVIDEIIENGILSEERKEENCKYYRLEKKINNFDFAVIILKTSKKYSILSCFIITEYKKKRPV